MMDQRVKCIHAGLSVCATAANKKYKSSPHTVQQQDHHTLQRCLLVSKIVNVRALARRLLHGGSDVQI